MDQRTSAPNKPKSPMPNRKSVAESSPPRLRFHVFKHAKMLLLFNILPIICSIYLFWQWRVGHITFRTISEESRATGAAVIVAGVSFAVVCYFLMPIAYWLRDNPTWHLRRSGSPRWILPTICGWMLWTIIGIFGILAAGAAVVVCVIGIWRLFSLAGT
jgi:hypothetical protein